MTLDTPDKRDHVLKMTTAAVAPLPEEVNFQNEMPHVHNQGMRGTCTTYAAVACMEHKISTPMSASFATWAGAQMHDPVANTTRIPTWIGSMREAMKTLNKIGTCEERYFNDDAPLDKAPPDHCWALARRVTHYSAVRAPEGTDWQWWFRYILQYHTPIAVSSWITADWRAPDMWGNASTGTFAARAATGAHLLGEPDSPYTQLHAYTICGYKPGWWRILNQWTRYWGDKGFAWIPNSYHFYDAWAVSRVEG